MPAVQVDHITKTFDSIRAVDDVSFDVERGELFGLLGPNGAGKTTTIRILLDIFKPDTGKIAVLGGPMSEGKKDRIGYLPEERGLYQDIQLERALVYLATLKNLSPVDARSRVAAYLEKFDLVPYRHKKIKELSKGMQQKAQLIVTFVHKPELVIIDEPFSALDPVNTQMVKDLLREERDRGTTIIMCTHQMNLVEELCDRIVLIDQGRTVLYGSLESIRRQFSSREILIRPVGSLPDQLPGISHIQQLNGGTALLRLVDKMLAQDALRMLVEQKIEIDQFEIAVPTLDEIFIQVVSGEGNQR
ncbi:MAG: ATP-binding cassette domain-containing protein [Bacteroidales bacterium]|nr:ATP-binding cassette domain-containing protein [Bacteroidales bacterium]